ncbi:MAG: hypothetical protein KC910_31785, partial [Candidatus Eremiobacteraeota bacterium]|nr:hypothetical protein [Candidatus Eremiobacteraeota bacterium]
MIKRLPRLAGAVLLLAGLLACIGPGVSRTKPEAERPHVFEMELGELVSQPPPPLKRPAVEPLAAEVIEQLAPAVVEPERKAFARRQDSKPPKPPKILEHPFHPRTGDAPTSIEGPLEVLRVMPKGAVGRVPHLSVTFNQPMLALGAERASPVKLSPEPPGQWRWVGDRTLLFEPDGGFPMATDYSVVVPADTASAAGRRLAQAQEWTFSTPPPSLKESYPESDRVSLRPVIFLRFDQKMRPADVLAHLKVTVGSAQYPLALASAVERAEDGQVLELVDEAEPDTWVAVRPTQELPRDGKVTVTLAAGCPSAEGPVPTDKPQAFDFHTYSPLKLAEKSHQPIRPGEGLWLRFNNPIDSRSFVKAMVRVEPSIPDFEVELQGDLILLEGTTSPKTTYTVSCHPKLTDVYGQQLGARAPFVFKVGKASPSLSSPASRYYRVDPKRPVFPVE